MPTTSAELVHDIGDRPLIFFETTKDGQPDDPATVELRIRKPSGSLLVIAWPDPGSEIANPSTGRFEHAPVLDQHGVWYYRWTAVGDVVSAEQGDFYVRQKAF